MDNTILKTLNTISSQQNNATKTSESAVHHLIDYCASHPDATIFLNASDMILQLHANASYMNEPQACSTAKGHFFLGNKIIDGKPILLNGAVHSLCTILKLVAPLAAEAELGALFLNACQAKHMRVTLEEMGHPQPPTPIISDNSTAVGIANRTIKKQRYCAMEMRYFWLVDQAVQGNFDVQWRPGLENLCDYVTKHHAPAHLIKVRPLYLHTQTPHGSYPAQYHLVFCEGVLILPRTGCLDTTPDAGQTRQRTEH
eukprot:15352991-Ditylum_brightwellii.AAC.1